MKNIKTTLLILIVMSSTLACNKTNFNPPADPSSSTMEKKYGGGTIKDFIKPENFVSGITNPYLPLTPGDTLFYTNVTVEDGDTTIEDIYVTTTSDIKVIQGINCEVVHDQVNIDGILSEDTYDWFAQDIFGTVWYFGEDTKSYDSIGNYSTEGSFESGVNSALAGFVMPWNPKKVIGQTYRQEYSVGVAQDKATVISTTETVTIGLGTYTNCVETRETSVLDPGVVEYKWYAPGIGQILTSVTTGGDEHEELIGMN